MESGAVRRDYKPEGEAAKTGLFATLKRTLTEFQEDNLSDWAAALTYYGLLSLFPALIAMLSLIGIFGDPKTTTDTLTEIITELGPASAAETFEGPIDSIVENQSAAGFAFVVGLAVALWSASGYVGAFTRASNIIYETPEGRPFWKLRPLQIAVTLAMILMMALLAVGLVLTGPVVEAIAGPVGLSGTAVDVWNVAKWPAMAAIFVLMVDLLYYATPEREAARLQVGHSRCACWRSWSGRSPRRCSPSTSPTSAPTTRPTAPSADSSRCCSGSGSPTWRSSSAIR